MFQRSICRFVSLGELTPLGLLEAVRRDPGNTSQYYATRYFGGKDKEVMVNQMLWSELKRFGQVTIERLDGPSAPGKWHPTMSSPRRAKVRLHNPDEEDLSCLKNFTPSQSISEQPPSAARTSTSPLGSDAPPANVSQTQLEAIVTSLVKSYPRRDIHFYLQQLVNSDEKMLAPSVFKKLRLDGSLVRERSDDGDSFLWRVTGEP